MAQLEPRVRANSRDELLDVALSQFASAGFAATSLQQIADAAGFSKSSVLYHFDSKEAMLTAALEPAERELEQLVTSLAAATKPGSAKSATARRARREFLESFVDHLMRYRREAAILVIQGRSLAGIPVIDRSNEFFDRLAGVIASSGDVRVQMRIGVGLAGAAYTLAVGAEFAPAVPPDGEIRAALLDVLAELFELES